MADSTRKKKKKKKKSNKVLLIVFIACIAVAVVAACNLISIGLTYKQAQDEYVSLQQYAVPQDSNEIEIAEAEVSSGEVTKTAPISVDFEALQAVNPDIVGWLYIEVEDISYPIVQGEDNDEYLHTTVEGTYNFSGSIFMECQNSSDFSDPNTIIYGHNMKDESMFGKLDQLLSFEDYLINDTFWIITPDAAYEYKIFNLEYTVADSAVYTLFSGPTEELTEYITARASKSSVQFALGEYDENSKIATLSTCAEATGDGRFVVQGILTGTW